MPLACSGLTKTYRGAEGEVIALRPTSVELTGGSFISLMGRSGSGKSTLLRLLSGIEAPDAGSLVVDGQPIESAADRLSLRRGCVAVVQQDYNLVPELTLAENILLAQHLSGASSLTADEALARVGLGGMGARLPWQASGGEQQRAAIARALAVGARYIVADEPTGALDESSATTVCELLRGVTSAGVGVLVATHDALVDTFADTRWRITGGEVVPQ